MPIGPFLFIIFTTISVNKFIKTFSDDEIKTHKVSEFKTLQKLFSSLSVFWGLLTILGLFFASSLTVFICFLVMIGFVFNSHFIQNAIECLEKVD